MTKVSKGAGKKSAPNKKIMRAIMKSHLAIKDDPRNQTVVGINPKDAMGQKKPALSLVPPAALVYTALAMKNGADKYSRANWRENNVIATIYIDAALRHLCSWLDGEECAEDSGVPHLGHALATISILVDALEGGVLVDDRPTAGPGAAVIKKFSKV